jgi:hypothetical protein
MFCTDALKNVGVLLKVCQCIRAQDINHASVSRDIPELFQSQCLNHLAFTNKKGEHSLPGLRFDRQLPGNQFEPFSRDSAPKIGFLQNILGVKATPRIAR